MPRYDVQCDKCGYQQEVVLTFAEQKAGAKIDGQLCPAETVVGTKACNGRTKQIITDRATRWDCAGGTRGYGRSSNVPALDQNRNFGHNPPTVGELGLTKDECKQLGIDDTGARVM